MTLALKKSRKAGTEDLIVWVMKRTKSTKNGNRCYSYWMAFWRVSDKVHNMHLGQCIKLDAEAAMVKARKPRQRS